jgi:hypothetical protein
MPYVKILVPCLIGSAWREKGEIVEVPPRVAEQHTRAGTATPVDPPQPQPPTHQQATAEPRSEKAVAPRQR